MHIEREKNLKRRGNIKGAEIIHGMVFIIILFGFGKISPIEPLTKQGMNIIGIFLALLYGWIFINLIWPSLFGLLALAISGYMDASSLFAASFGNEIVVMMFFVFIFSETINYHGLSKFISLWFISRKIVQGRPWLFSYMFFISIAILGAFTSATPAAIIGWSILYGIFDVCDYQKKDGYVVMMILGCVFFGQIGMSLMPFKQLPLTVIAAYESISGEKINYMSYMFLATIVMIIFPIIYICLSRYFFKPDVSKLTCLSLDKLKGENELKLTAVQTSILIFLLLLVVMLVLPGILPESIYIVKLLKSIGNTGICVFIVAVMSFLKIQGTTLLDFKKMVDCGVSWGIILLLAVVQPISAAFSNDSTGILLFISQVLDPIFGDHSSMFFVFVMGLAAILMANVMNNGAVGVALMPIVYSYSIMLGLDPGVPTIMIIMMVHCSILMPSASSSAALLYGSEWIDSKSIIRIAPSIMIIYYLVVVLYTSMFV